MGSFTANKIILDTTKNFWHLAPGENKWLWNDLRKLNYLGYEWCKVYLGDLKNLNKEKYDRLSSANGIPKKYRSIQQAMYFSKVKCGDYFCIISGKEFLGLAEVLENYNYKDTKLNNQKLNKFFKEIEKEPFQTVKIKWLKKNDRLGLLYLSYRKTFCRLNNGKRWKNLLKILNDNNIDSFFDNTISSDMDKKVIKHEKAEKNSEKWQRNTKFVNQFKAKNENFGCKACGFDKISKYRFSKEKPFLEFHHIEKLSKVINKRYILNNQNVALLCPNCHRAIHRIMSEKEKSLITIDSFKKNYLIKNSA